MRYISVILLLCTPITLCAQQPPHTLPSLIQNEQSKDFSTTRNETIHGILKENIFVKAVASKPQVYAGEPFLVSYKLYTAYNSEARVIKQPSFDDCSVLELTIKKEPYPETINGKIFHVFELRKVQLTAVNAGIIETGSITVESIVQVSADEKSTAENFSITSLNEPQLVRVKPLPLFSGEGQRKHTPVGHFFIQASVAENKTGAGEKNNLQIKISGNGNFASVDEPAVKWPDNVEVFGSNSSSFLNQDDFPVTGYKVFDIPFAGSVAGDIIIPPIQFSFFNPDTGQYQLTETWPVSVSFTNAMNADTGNHSITDYTNRKYLWIIVAIAFVVVFVVVLTAQVKKRKAARDANEKKEREVADATKQELIFPEKNTLTASLGNLYKDSKGYDFLSGSKEMLLSAMQSYTGLSENGESDLINRAEAKDKSVSLLCRRCLSEINIHLYTQGAIELDHEKLYAQLKELIEKLCAE